MLFGLSKGPSVFQALINDMFRKELRRTVIVYIDDILIYSETLSEHVNHVRSSTVINPSPALRETVQMRVPPDENHLPGLHHQPRGGHHG